MVRQEMRAHKAQGLSGVLPAQSGERIETERGHKLGPSKWKAALAPLKLGGVSSVQATR